MKVTKQLLIELGLQKWMRGTQQEVPSFFEKDIDLIYKNKEEIVAVMAHRYLNDHRIYARIMIILNQMVRYYKCQVTLYCLSYRAIICREKIYLVFKKSPCNKEN